MILFGGAGLDGDDRSINLCDLHKLDTAPDEIARDCTRLHEIARDCTSSTRHPTAARPRVFTAAGSLVGDDDVVASRRERGGAAGAEVPLRVCGVNSVSSHFEP